MKPYTVGDRGKEVGPGDPCVGEPGETWVMTLHLGTIGHGVDELLDVGDWSCWAMDQ